MMGVGADGIARIASLGVGKRHVLPVTTPNQLSIWIIHGYQTDIHSDLKLVSINARSIKNKTTLIHNLILDEAFITEIWVTDEVDVNLSLISSPGFRF